jgi:hypothetical protein
LAVNLNLDLSGPGLFRRIDSHAAPGKRRRPDGADGVAGGQIIVVVTGSEIAGAQPSGRRRSRIVVAVLGYKAYEDNKKPQGVQLNIGPAGITMEKK